jgi:hypothetical protein
MTHADLYLTLEELIMHHHEDIKKVKEMLKNIPKDLGAVFKRLDTLERQQIKFYKSWIKLLEDMDNG